MDLNMSRCVRGTLADRCAAIRQYVRPEDIEGRAVRVPMRKLRQQSPGITRAGSVARIMQLWFARGALRYIPDPEWCDLWGRPWETFRRGGGDCDDLSIVGLSAFRFIGLQTSAVVVGLMYQRGTVGGHAWIEGEDDAGWFLMETTNGGELIRGARPNSHDRRYEPQYILTPEACVLAPASPPRVHGTRVPALS